MLGDRQSAQPEGAQPAGTDSPAGRLSELDQAILAFAEHAPRAAGVREEAVRARLGISPMRYYQRLNALVDEPAARASHPLLIGRLERMRERRW